MERLIPYSIGIVVITILAALFIQFSSLTGEPVEQKVLQPVRQWQSQLQSAPDEWTFNPTSRTYNNLDSNYNDQNFLATSSIPTGLVLWIKANDSLTDQTATDSSGNNNNAACQTGNCPIHNPTGGPDNSGAYQFDGTDYLQISNSSTLEWSSNESTLALWIKIPEPTATGYHPIFVKRVSQTNRYEVGPAWDELYFTTASGENYDDLTVSITNYIQPNNWHHLVFISDSSGKKIYIDGQLRTSNNQQNNNFQINAAIALGKRNTEYYNGWMDDIRLYNRALTETEIQNLYSGQPGALTANAGNDKTITTGGSTTLDGSASGGTTPYSYSWTPATGLNNPSIATPTASPSTTTTYTLTVTDSTTPTTQTATDSVLVTVQPPTASLTVTPATGLTSSGNVGGPFTPNSTIYTLTNNGTANLNWTAAKTQNWTTVSSSSGTLAAGANTTVTVSINSNANSLTTGSYSDTVSFTNTTNHTGDTTRTISLTVSPGGTQSMTTASPSSCVAPCNIFFDAVDASGWNSSIIQPANLDYASFNYVWDFGNTGSGNWATNGKSRNHATGYVTAHVFENPGNYSVSLNITDSAGQLHQYQQTVTIQSFSGTTYYVSSSDPNRSDSGPGTETQPFATLGKAMSMIATNTKVLFKRGDTFTTNSVFSPNIAGPVILAAYGSGEKPIIQTTNASQAFFNMNSNTSDWRFVDLDLRGAGSYGIRNQQTSNLLLRVQLQGFSYAIVNIDGTPNNVAVVDSKLFPNGTYGMYCAPNVDPLPTRVAVMGNEFDGSGSGEHPLRTTIFKAFINSNRFQNCPATKDCIKFWGWVPPRDSAYSIISDNEFIANGGAGWLISPGPQDSSSGPELIRDLVIERNIFRDPADSGKTAIGSRGVTRMTIRNNLVINLDGLALATNNPPGITYDNWRIYNNTIYTASNNTEIGFIRAYGTQTTNDLQNWVVKNNIFSASQNNNSSSAVIDARDYPTSSFSFNNNLYYFPLIGDARMRVGGSTKSFSQWQALGQDPASIAPSTDPLLVNPASNNPQLQSSSPAINAGASLEWTKEDYFEYSRPYPIGGNWDIGAFEYHP